MQKDPALKDFVKIQGIRHNEYEKTIALWGHFGDPSQNAVVILKGQLPKEPNLKEISKLERYNQNERYYYYTGYMGTEYTIEIIYPATKEKHYHKYRDKLLNVKLESPADYAKKNLQKQLKYNLWVTDILQGKKEVDRVLYRNDDPKVGFILLKDSDMKDEEKGNLHLLGIIMDSSLHSLRDLRSQHIKLLKDVQETARKIIRKNYGLQSYREFFHYPPTFWHLHVHFLSLEVGGRSTMIERCHELNQVIYNLSIFDGYYRDGTFTVLAEDHSIGNQ